MEHNRRFDFIALVGPTGVGKSRVAIELLEKHKGAFEVVCMDSCQIYEGALIGTDSPTEDEKRKGVFHLYNFLKPSETFSAGDYARMAKETIREINNRGRIPLLVGGTGFYLSAIMDGFHEVGEIDEEVRKRVVRIVEGYGVERAFRLLNYLDSDTGGKIDKRNPMRVARALEIIFSTGKRLSDIRKEEKVNDTLNGLIFGITLPLCELDERIENRTIGMIYDGFVEEVRGLMEAGYGLGDPVFKAIGYEDIYYYLMGAMSLNRVVDKIICDTIGYAKRQLTWFTADERVWWLPCPLVDSIDYYEYLANVVSSIIKRFMGVVLN